jgi:transposase-like protein
MELDTQTPRTYTREERAEWVRRYRASGMGLKRFAAEHGLKLLQLHYWVYPKGASKRKRAAKTTPVFQEIPLAQALGGANWDAEVSLRDGTVARFRAGTDAAWMKSLLEALHP